MRQLLVTLLGLLLSTSTGYALNEVSLESYRDKLFVHEENFIMPDGKFMAHMWKICPYKKHPLGISYTVSTPVDSEKVVDEVAYVHPHYLIPMTKEDFPYGWVDTKPLRVTSTKSKIGNTGYYDRVEHHAFGDGSWIEYSYFTGKGQSCLYSVQTHHSGK